MEGGSGRCIKRPALLIFDHKDRRSRDFLKPRDGRLQIAFICGFRRDKAQAIGGIGHEFCGTACRAGIHDHEGIGLGESADQRLHRLPGHRPREKRIASPAANAYRGVRFGV